MKKALALMLALLGIHRHLSAEQKQDIAIAAVQTTPGGAVTAGGFRLVGLPLSDWLVLASIAFAALQAACGISFFRSAHVGMIPTCTNLLHFGQAKAMLEHCINGSIGTPPAARSG